MIPPPSFVIRNSIHSTTTDNVDGISFFPEENGVESIGNVASRNTRNYEPGKVHTGDSTKGRHTPAIVQLFQAKEGAYMLDFECANDPFISIIYSTKDKDDANNYESYIDENAWGHLLVYSELVGKPISKDKNGYVKRSIPVVNSARDTNASSFILLEDDAKEVSRTLLDVGRLFEWCFVIDKVHEGKIQWNDVRSCLSTVRKCVPFTNHDGLVQQVANAITFHQYYVFAKMLERHIESSVPTEFSKSDDAQMADVFPSFDSISNVEKEIELMASIRDREVQDNAKASGLVILMRKLDLEKCNNEWRHYSEFAENDIEIQRNAMECGISEHSTWSKDSLLAFGSGYYGSGRDTIPGEAAGSMNVSSIEVILGEERCQRVYESVLGNSETEAKKRRSHEQPNDGDQVVAVTSNLKIGTRADQSPVLDIMSIEGSKIQPSVKPISMRCQLLRRATLQFDTLKLLFSKKKDPKLRGIKLFRSKVRLVVMIRRLVGSSPYQLPAVVPENLDIFSRLCYVKPLTTTTPSGGHVNKELLARAIAHRDQMLGRKIVKNWMSWIRHCSVEEQRKEGMVQDATAAHQRTVTLQCFRAIRMQTTQQTGNKASSVSETRPTLQNEIGFGMRRPSIDDEQLPVLVSELDGMELVVGQNRPSGVDEVPEDLQHLTGYQDLRREPTQQQNPANNRFQLLDKATLQRMKREKLAGASNLFDVPLEVIHSSFQTDMNNVEYKNRETVSRIVDRV